MSTEQDNFAGMTAEQKVKALILLSIRDTGEVSPITKDVIDGLFDAYDYEFQKEEIRFGVVQTEVPCSSMHGYVSQSVAAQLPDGSWVGWTFWDGGGIHSAPDEIEWMKHAYHLDCTEEQKLVTVRSFAKVGA